MHLAWFALIANQAPVPAAETWVCHEEAYALKVHDGELHAGTFGGVIKLRDNGWEEAASPINGLAASPSGEAARSDRTEFDEARDIVLNSQTQKPIGRPGTGKIYALYDLKEETFAATSDGIWRYSKGAWSREKLPSQSPMPRLQGLASAGRRGWIAGGLGGLFIGRPGGWEKLGDKSVRRVVAGRGDEVWIVYGDGGLDKLETDKDRWAHDVLYGMVKRPWASCISVVGDSILIGGQGGWVEKTDKSQREEHPDWLAGDVVTSMTLWKGQLIIGGQKTGLHIREGKKWRHLNAAHGLEDLWISDLIEWKSRLMIATAGGGLHQWDGKSINKLETPAQNLTALTVWRSDLVIGSMHGAHCFDGKVWRPLGDPAEVTALGSSDSALRVILANKMQSYR